MLKDVSEMRTYFALVRKEPESDYGVDFTDFPGCVPLELHSKRLA
jgi:hypothetical protein